MRGVALIALAACGSSSEPSSAPLAPEPALLGEAARLAKTNDELVALARADLARGAPARARELLGRVDRAWPLLATRFAAVDVHALLGEDRAAELQRAVQDLEDALVSRDEFLAVLATVEAKPVVARVALALARVPLHTDFQRFADLVDDIAAAGELAPGTPLWQAVVAGVAGDPEKLVVLARTARRLGAREIASALVHDAAAKGTGFALAEELALQHEPALAREIADRSAIAHASPAVARVLETAAHAELEAVLGDAAASRAWEAKLPALASLEDHLDNHTAERLEGMLGIALAVRGATAEAIPHFHDTADDAAGIAAFLVEAGRREAAIRAAAEMPGAKHATAIAAIIRIDLMAGERDLARDLAIAAGSGLELVLLADARAGDVAAVTGTLAQDRSPTAAVTRLVVRMQLARALAKRGSCDLARPLAGELGNAMTYAIVARDCPP